MTLGKQQSSWMASWSKSHSWPGGSAFRGRCLWNVSQLNGKKPFCSASAMPLSSGEASRAWRSTTTSNQRCSRSCKDIVGENTTCFCTSKVCIVLRRSLPMSMPVGRRAASKIWSAMREETTSCRFQRAVTWKRSTLTCAPELSHGSAAHHGWAHRSHRCTSRVRARLPGPLASPCTGARAAGGSLGPFDGTGALPDQ